VTPAPSSPPASPAPPFTTLIIGIAGGTGSGKSTVAKNIARGLPETAVATIDHDAYYRQRDDLSLDERSRLNYDHPDSLDNALLVQHLQALKAGQAVDVPVYDFVSHSRRPETRRVTPAPVTVVEGILVFVDPGVRRLLDIKIFVDTDSDLRVFRRIRRDMEHRGRTFQQIREQYYRTVRPMHVEFVEPSKRYADLIIPEGGENHVALDFILSKLIRVVEQGHQRPTTPEPAR
jgi:uridine kinase